MAENKKKNKWAAMEPPHIKVLSCMFCICTVEKTTPNSYSDDNLGLIELNIVYYRHVTRCGLTAICKVTLNFELKKILRLVFRDERANCNMSGDLKL